MKRNLIFLSAVCLVLSAIAKNERVDEINAIKKSGDCLYAEATMPTAEEAEQVAASQLREEIIHWSSEHLESPIDSIRAEQLSAEADSLMMPRANRIRVFLYIAKARLVPQSQSAKVRRDSTLLNDSVRQIIMKRFFPNSGTLRKMMEARNFFQLQEIMEPLKASGEISGYGKYATATDPANSYLIVYDIAGNIRAWLGKGGEERPNLKTGQKDTLKNYHSCGAIWFQLNE